MYRNENVKKNKNDRCKTESRIEKSLFRSRPDNLKSEYKETSGHYYPGDKESLNLAQPSN